MTPEQRAARIRHHMYETCEGIAEHAERIVKLEELVIHLYACVKNFESVEGNTYDCERCPMGNHAHDCEFELFIQELGIEVNLMEVV